MELASGEMAIPASPIAPERASATIRRKGTAVTTVFVHGDPSRLINISLVASQVHWACIVAFPPMAKKSAIKKEKRSAFFMSLNTLVH